MHTKFIVSTLLSMLLVASNLSGAAPLGESAKFNLSNRTVIGGEERWDYLTYETKHHRVFVSRSTHVQAIDADSKQIIGDIPNTEGVHGIAIADDLNVGFTSNGKSNSVTAFDLSTLKQIKVIKISGSNPDGIFYEPKSKHVFTFNGRSSNATVIDAVSLKEINTVALAGKPEAAVSDLAGNIYVNIEDKNEIAVIDGVTNKVVKSYQIGSGVRPTGLAIDQKHDRLFSVCGNGKAVILDSESGKVIAEVPIGSGPDAAAFDSSLGLAFSSNGEGSLTVIKETDPDHFSVVQNAETQKGARTLAYDQESHRAFLVTASFGDAPPATKDDPKPRPPILPKSVVILEVTSK